MNLVKPTSIICQEIQRQRDILTPQECNQHNLELVYLTDKLKEEQKRS